jgi:uncharacterized phiE125 gp8 family phage protein
MTHPVGSQVPIPFTVRDATGAPVAFATASISVEQPDGTVVVLTIGDGITVTGVGEGVGVFVPAQAGRHATWGATAGPSSVIAPDAFSVVALSGATAPAVGIAEARSWLNISTPEWDPLVRRALAAATGVAEGWTGQLLRRTVVTEAHAGGAPTVRLLRAPIQSVTGVTEAGVALTGSDFVLLEGDGLLLRGNGAATREWSGGDAGVVVEYVAGHAVIPDRLLAAVAELTRHVFASLQRGGARDDEYSADEQVRAICATLLGPRHGTFA